MYYFLRTISTREKEDLHEKISERRRRKEKASRIQNALKKNFSQLGAPLQAIIKYSHGLL